MTTKKKTCERIKSAVEKAKNDLTDKTTTTTTGCCDFKWADGEKIKDEITVTTEKTDGEKTETLHFCWNDASDEKRKLAKDILIRLIDFNLEQLSRQDVDKVLIYDNPAEYAASVVNELYERIKK